MGVYIAGVDEAGRGPLAGPVIAAAVILSPDKPIVGIRDSKQLTSLQREALFETIYCQAIAVGVGRAEVEEIDILNILQASLLAMKRAVDDLKIKPTSILVDGKHCPHSDYPCRAVIGGDGIHESIGAASIIAKVTRDREMHQLDETYPGYGFAIHKGYPTKLHLLRLQELGVSYIHRKTFGPVKAVLSVVKEPVA